MPRARLLQQDDEQDAEHDDFELRAVARECRKDVLQDVLEQRDDGRADHGAGDVAGAADQRHQQQLDAGAEVERRRAHVALHVRIEPAGQACQQSGENENRKPHAEEIDREAFHHGDAAAQAADGAALARVEQVPAQQHDDAEQPPDEEVDRGGAGERDRSDRDRRNAGQPAVAPERIDVAEQEIDGNAPGDRAQRQEVTAEPQRRGAENRGDEPGAAASASSSPIQGEPPCTAVYQAVA